MVPRFIHLSVKHELRIHKNTSSTITLQNTDGEFLSPAFIASRVQHISDLHSKFALEPHHV